MEYLRLAKIPGEGDVFGVGDMLAGKHQDQMVHPDGVQFAEPVRIERLAHVHTAHLRAECGMQLADGKARGQWLRLGLTRCFAPVVPLGQLEYELLMFVGGYSGCSVNSKPMARAW